MSQSRLSDLLALSTVPRWPIVPCLRLQSVAEHSFRVAVIGLEIARRLNKGVTPSSVVVEYHVMRWALVHDGPEAETSDIPYPVKKVAALKAEIAHLETIVCPWYVDEDLGTNSQERAVVKIADKIEEVLFMRDWGMGPKADAAGQDARQQVIRHVEEARSRFGWPDLPDIVQSILTINA